MFTNKQIREQIPVCSKSGPYAGERKGWADYIRKCRLARRTFVK